MFICGIGHGTYPSLHGTITCKRILLKLKYISGGFLMQFFTFAGTCEAGSWCNPPWGSADNLGLAGNEGSTVPPGIALWGTLD